MAQLGSAVDSAQLDIGSVEVRVGALSSAGKLTQAHSLGVVDSFTFEGTINSVSYNALFPSKQIATAIIENLSKATLTYGENSVRNLNLHFGNGLVASVVANATTLATTTAAAATSFTVATGTGSTIAAGETYMIYPAGHPELMSLVQVASISTDTVTVVTGQSLPVAYDLTVYPVVHVVKSQAVGFGAASYTQYFTVDAIKVGFTDGKPRVWRIWKASIGGTASIASSRTDFARPSMELSILAPDVKDVAALGALNHVAGEVAKYPLAAYYTAA